MELRYNRYHVWSCLLSLFSNYIPLRKVRFIALVILDYNRYFSQLQRSFGDPASFKIMKEVERRIKDNYVSGPPSRKPRYKSFGIWQKTDRYGIPLRLHRLSRLARLRKAWAKAVVCCIAGSYRAYEGAKLKWKLPKSIVKRGSPTWRFNFTGFRDALLLIKQKFNLRRFSIKGDRLLARDMWKGTASPSSSVSARGAPTDALFLLNNKPIMQALQDIYEGLLSFVTRTPDGGFSGWLDWLKSLSALAPKFRPSSTKPANCIARFTYVADKGGKLRGVTPINYHIQAFLRPIHDYFMQLLRVMPCDATFTEEKAKVWLAERTGKNKAFVSYDLPAATDQFPVEVLASCVEFFFNEQVASGYKRLMKLPVYIKGFGITSYVRGCPMGIYGMWPVFAMCHHGIVQMSAIKHGLSVKRKEEPLFFSQYRIRGDDNALETSLVEASPEMLLAKTYKQIMEGLGFRLGSEKSLEAFDKGGGVASFAKRTYVHGSVLERYTYAELKAASVVDSLILVRLAQEILSSFNCNIPKVGLRRKPNTPDTIVTSFLLPLQVGGPEWLPVQFRRKFPPIESGILRKMRADDYTRKLRRLLSTLSVWSLTEILPPIWRSEPTVDLSLANHKVLLEHLNLWSMHDLAYSVAREVEDTSFVKLSGLVGQFQSNTPTMKAAADLDIFKEGVRPELLNSEIEQLPIYKAYLRIAENVSLTGDMVTGGLESYKQSLAIRAFQEMRGMTEILRVRTRKLGRLAILSKFLEQTNALARSLHYAEWELVSEDPPCWGRWVKTSPVSSDLILRTENPHNSDPFLCKICKSFPRFCSRVGCQGAKPIYWYPSGVMTD